MENKYEYLIYELSYKPNNPETTEQLNDLGFVGWEMVSAQLKPIKNERTNSFEFIYTFKKLL